MGGIRTWAIAIAGLFVFGILALIGHETTFFAALWVMVAFLFALFVWLVSTVISRRAKRGNEQ
jgi:uncharacterized protein (DUF58 family)